MSPRILIYPIVAMWVLVTLIVVGYPLWTGRIRVGLAPVLRETSPRAFWTAYAVSTLLFVAVSLGVGFFMRWVLFSASR